VGIETIRYRREKMGGVLFIAVVVLAGLHAGGVF
jgi:hypothetical protein